MQETKTAAIVRMKNQNISTKVIAETLGISTTSVSVLFWKHRHPAKARAHRANYERQPKTREQINARRRRWYANLPEEQKREMLYRQKCHAMGITPE